MFKHLDDWTHETIEWWNMHAFLQHLHNGTASKNKEQAQPDPESDNDVLHIRARHAKQVSRNPPTSNVSMQINEDPEVLAPAHKKAAPVNKWHKKPAEQEDIFTDTVDSPGMKTHNAMVHAHNQPQVRCPPKKQKNGF
ncbi:hypothetical protein M404DRAFT_26442 [Pisolithus tinctorius Marx 270]|uniref:Uncharacterized protein n=1 Tax=Pisolithus tinctorius Marx 270 TaxID=870435 RepID=A0A0C3K3X3_PISTI|nr:hypothetical protein M404DRAFT_26442 [Pisolithus tinctorius Marx 270]